MTKVVILAGGLGTRLAEETEAKPKPMVEVGGYPILWHIMKHYGWHGFNEFFIALGYKGETIKRFFLDYHTLSGSMTVDTRHGGVKRHERECENWMTHLIDTGAATQTGGRVRRLQPWLQDGTFMVTYGDGVCDVDLQALLRFHRAHGKIATVTAVRPPSRFGEMVFDGNLVAEFTEKSQFGEGWINGGFLVFEPAVFDYLGDDNDVLEVAGLERLAADRQLAAFQHDGFWQCMDTLRDKRLLEGLWQGGKAAWKQWE